MPKLRIPHDEMRSRYAERVGDFADSLGCEWYFGGSYRRNSPTVGDLDLVLIDRPLGTVEWPEWISPHRGGDRAVNAVVDGELGLDVWNCAEREWGCFGWYVTGPKDLNVFMRSAALGHGWKLSQYNLLVSGAEVFFDAEPGVSGTLDLPWIEPRHRDAWRDIWVERAARHGSSTSIQGDSGTYVLTVWDNGTATCTCPGFTYRRTCKHVQNPEEWQ